MVIQLQNKKTYIINDIKDLKEIVDPEVFEAIEYFIENGEDRNLQEQFNNLQEEFNSYEATNESLRDCLLDTQNVLEELKKKLNNTKRINKVNKVNMLDCIESMIDTINDEI